MEIFRSPSAHFLMTDFIWKRRHYHSVSAGICFALSSGRIVDAGDAMKTVTEAYPELILDESLPKLSGEWGISGRIRRRTGTGYGLAEVCLGDTCKRIYADFSGIDADAIGTDSEEAEKRLYLYENSVGPGRRTLRGGFQLMRQDHPARLEHWGSAAKCDLYALPDDFDFRYCSRAPEDQRTRGEWKAGDSYRIWGFASSGNAEEYRGSLPAADIRCFAVSSDKQKLSKADIKEDSVYLLPEIDLGIIYWHGLFEYSPDSDFSLVMAVLGQDYASDGKPPQDEYFAALALDILKDKEKREKPEHILRQKSERIRREARSVLLKRYSDIYNEYFCFQKIFSLLPRPEPLCRDRISGAEEARLRGALERIASTAESHGVSRAEIPGLEKDSALGRILAHEILPEEMNFRSQISALMYDAIVAMGSQDCSGLITVNSRKLQNFTVRRFMLGYIPKPLSCKRSDWGLEGGGTFEIPAGLAVPEFFGTEITSVTVYPRGIANPGDFFVIPGSEPAGAVCWHGTGKEKFCPKIMVDNVTDGLLLAEEVWHLYDVQLFASPKAAVNSKLLEECGQADYIMIPARDDLAEETFRTWSDAGICGSVAVIPFGSDKNGRPFSSLRERLLYSDETVAQWLERYLPYPLPEPEHITMSQYMAAYDQVLTQKAGLRPGTMDFTSRALEINEEKRREVLALCKTAKERDTVNGSFDKSAREIGSLAGASDDQLMAKAMELQKRNLAENFKKLPESCGVEGDPLAELEKHLEAFRSRFEAASRQDRELAEHLEEIEKFEQRTPEEQISATNLTAEDLLAVEQSGITSLTSISVSRRSWAKRDFTGWSFSDADFNEIDFSRCRFVGTKFTNCVFAGCAFSEVHLQNAEFRDCEFIECSFSESVWESCLGSDLDFLNCSMSRMNLRKMNWRNVLMSVTAVSASAFEDGTMEAFNSDFSRFHNTSFSGCDLQKTKFTEAELKDCLFEQCQGAGVLFDTSVMHGMRLAGAKLERVEFSSCSIQKLVADGSFIRGLTIDRTRCAGSDFSGCVLEDLYARGSDLSQGRFRKTVARKATFTECLVRSADFFHANLFKADLSGSKFGGTSFEEANLYGADFRNTALSDNNFSGSIMDRTIIPFMAVPKL